MKKAISDERIGHFRSLLFEKRRSLQSNKEPLEAAEGRKRNPDQTGEVSHLRLHNADLATDEADKQTDARITQAEIHAIQEIEDALARIERSTYGRCESCGDAISEQRLEALPEARYCIECARAEEDQNERAQLPSAEQDKPDFLYEKEYSKRGFQ